MLQVTFLSETLSQRSLSVSSVVRLNTSPKFNTGCVWTPFQNT